MPNKTVVLETMKEILGSPEKWEKGFYARRKDGMECSVNDEEAASFCLLGAWNKAVLLSPDTYNTHERAEQELDIIKTCIPRELRWIDKFNDDPDTTYEDIIAALDCAIGKATA